MEKVEQPPEDRDIVFCPGALGDTVLRMLAVRLLQLTGWLGGQVDCIGDRPYLKTCGFLTAGSRFFDFGEGVWWELFSAESQPSESLRAALAGVRRAIVWLPYDENAYQKLRNAGIQEIRWKAPRARDEGGPHELEYLTGMDRDELQSMLCAFPVGNPRQAPSSPSLAVIHPGAGSPRKRLPVSRYRRLASRLLQEGWKVLWLLGPAEVREASHLLPDVPGVQTQIDPPLEDVPALLGEASLVIGNDSGVMHLAAALGRPVVVAFTLADPSRWHPVGPLTLVLDLRPQAEARAQVFHYLEKKGSEIPAELKPVIEELSDAPDEAGPPGLRC